MSPATPPVPFRKLGANEVHLWTVRLDRSNVERAENLSVLSECERSKADRFRRTLDRKRYITSHVTLRTLLSQYLGIGSQEIALEAGKHGKPKIALRQNEIDLSFNLAHSGDLALIGVTKARGIGVDIEQHRPDAVEISVMKRFCSSREILEINGLSDAQRVAAFFDCWTRKEAYLKAVGCGLVDEICHVEISRIQTGIWRIQQSLPPAVDPKGDYQIIEAHTIDGYSASVAVEGSNTIQLNCFEGGDKKNAAVLGRIRS